MRFAGYCSIIILLFIPTVSQALDGSPSSFEMWEDHLVASATHPVTKPVIIPPSGVTERNSTSVSRRMKPASRESDSAQSPEEYVIHFGAGAAWMFPMRLAEWKQSDVVFSKISASWAPFGLVGEVGLDLALGRKSDFFLLPNLKFYFAKHRSFSIYLEGSAAIYSYPNGTDLGGGAGLGIILGLMDHLAIEFRASAVMFGFPEEKSLPLIGSSSEQSAGIPAIILCPSVGSRLVARF
jgi:hypothetical protein